MGTRLRTARRNRSRTSRRGMNRKKLSRKRLSRKKLSRKRLSRKRKVRGGRTFRRNRRQRGGTFDPAMRYMSPVGQSDPALADLEGHERNKKGPTMLERWHNWHPFGEPTPKKEELGSVTHRQLDLPLGRPPGEKTTSGVVDVAKTNPRST